MCVCVSFFLETNDLYMFGWGEWGQTAMSKEVIKITTPKICEVCVALMH